MSELDTQTKVSNATTFWINFESVRVKCISFRLNYELVMFSRYSDILKSMDMFGVKLVDGVFLHGCIIGIYGA